MVFVLSVVEVVVNDDSFFVADKNLRLCDFEVLDVKEKVDTVQDAFHLVV